MRDEKWFLIRFPSSISSLFSILTLLLLQKREREREKKRKKSSAVSYVVKLKSGRRKVSETKWFRHRSRLMIPFSMARHVLFMHNPHDRIRFRHGCCHSNSRAALALRDFPSKIIWCEYMDRKAWRKGSYHTEVAGIRSVTPIQYQRYLNLVDRDSSFSTPFFSSFYLKYPAFSSSSPWCGWQRWVGLFHFEQTEGFGVDGLDGYRGTQNRKG